MGRPLVHGLLYSAARHRDHEHRLYDDHHAQPIAVAVSGSLREIALIVVLLETIDIEPVDLWLNPTCRPLESVLEQRTGIRRVLFSPVQFDPSDQFALRLGWLPVYGRYRDVIQVATGLSAYWGATDSLPASVANSQANNNFEEFPRDFALTREDKPPDGTLI